MTVPRFWRKIDNRYNLKGTKCETCGGSFYPPRRMCPECRSEGEIVPHEFAKEGRVVTFTTIKTAPPSFEDQTPYVVAVIDTPDGARFTTQIIDCDPEEIEIGTEVEATFRRIAEDGCAGAIHYGLKFEPKDN